MDHGLTELLRELEEFGSTNDAATDDRSRKMLNITHDTGVFLALLVKASKAKKVLEIGTSNGYSTLWLADAVGEGGSVTTIEQAPHKRAMAERNFQRAGLRPAFSRSRTRPAGSSRRVMQASTTSSFWTATADSTPTGGPRYSGSSRTATCSWSTTRSPTPTRWKTSTGWSRPRTVTSAPFPRSERASW